MYKNYYVLIVYLGVQKICRYYFIEDYKLNSRHGEPTYFLLKLWAYFWFCFNYLDVSIYGGIYIIYGYSFSIFIYFFLVNNARFTIVDCSIGNNKHMHIIFGTNLKQVVGIICHRVGLLYSTTHF